MQIIRAFPRSKHADWLPTFLRDFCVKSTALAHVSDNFFDWPTIEEFGIMILRDPARHDPLMVRDRGMTSDALQQAYLTAEV